MGKFITMDYEYLKKQKEEIKKEVEKITTAKLRKKLAYAEDKLSTIVVTANAMLENNEAEQKVSKDNIELLCYQIQEELKALRLWGSPFEIQEPNIEYSEFD